MKSLDVFSDPELAELSGQASNSVLLALNGLPVAVGLSALFSVFVGIDVQSDVDAGTEFETMLATFEGRKCATHRGSMAIN